MGVPGNPWAGRDGEANKVAWAKLDDKFHGNPKVLQAGLPALGLYVLGLSYCADQLTDGQLSRKVVAGWKGWKPAADDLVRAGLWEETPRGYRVHDYLDWNPSREQLQRERADAAERKRLFRERRTDAGQNANATGDSGPPVPKPVPKPVPGVTEVTPGTPPNPPRKRRGREASGRRGPGVAWEDDGQRWEQRIGADGKREWVEVEA
jgi:hypothetical protein